MYVRFHPEADEELVEAQDWYDKQSESKHRCADRSEHRFVLKRFPYTIIYRVREDHVFVTAVAHHRRRPNYWRHRK